MRSPSLTISTLCLSTTLLLGLSPVWSQDAGSNNAPIVELDTSEGRRAVKSSVWLKDR